MVRPSSRPYPPPARCGPWTSCGPPGRAWRIRAPSSHGSPRARSSRRSPAGYHCIVDPSAPLDTDVAIETPEHIVFRYRVAGPARRLVAYLIDMVICYSSFVAVAIVVLLTTAGRDAFSRAADEVRTATGVGIGLLLLLL